MSDPIRGRFVSKDDLAKEFRARKRKVIYESVQLKSTGAREALVSQKMLDGWRTVKTYQTSTRIEKDKPLDEQLEDELWVLMASLGFSQISSSRLFNANIDGTFRQLDCVAVDDESVVVIECTQSDEPNTPKSMRNLIEKVASWRNNQRTYSLFKTYLHNNDLHIAFVIATRRIKWNKNDLIRAQDHNIVVIRDEQIDYFKRLVSHLKHAARYQFLAHVCRDKEVPGLEITVPATRAHIGKKIFYSCLVRPAHLLKIAYVNHKASANLESMETYQRLVTPKRLGEIAKFIDHQDFAGTFPTNVVLNLHSKKIIKFEKRDTIGQVQVGTLYLPAVYGSAFVVDGQHRLFGYAHSRRANNANDKTAFSVLAYDNLDTQLEAQMFVDINSEQKQVAKGLLNELNATLHRDAPDFTSRTGALASSVVQDLNADPESKLYARIKLTADKASTRRCLSITQLSEPMLRHKLFGEALKSGKDVPGPLSNSNDGTFDGDVKKACACLKKLFNFVAEMGPKQFDLGNLPGGYLWTNTGIRPLIGVFAAALRFVAGEQQLKLDMYPPSQFMPRVCELLKPVVLHFEHGDREEAQAFRDRTAMKGVTKNEYEMMRIVQGIFPKFDVPGLADYISKLDAEGTKEAHQLIDELELRMHEFILKELQAEYGTDKWGGQPMWWRQGVPERIRTDCISRQEKDNKPKDHPWKYLTLITHRDIVMQSKVWSKRFEKAFSLQTIGNKRDKAHKTMWMVHVNDVRNTTHHAIKGVCTRDEVKLVRAAHKHVMELMKGNSTGTLDSS